MRIQLRVIALFLLVVTAVVPGYGQRPEPNQIVVARLSFEKCDDSEVIYVYINESDSVSGRAVSGRGSFTGCGSYSYRAHAVRQSKKQVRVDLTVKIDSVSFEKRILLVLGKKKILRLADGVKMAISIEDVARLLRTGVSVSHFQGAAPQFRD